MALISFRRLSPALLSSLREVLRIKALQRVLKLLTFSFDMLTRPLYPLLFMSHLDHIKLKISSHLSRWPKPRSIEPLNLVALARDVAFDVSASISN